jgi:hypothetical protein
MAEPEAPAGSTSYGPAHRQRAQEIISAHIQDDTDWRDRLLADYCRDDGLLACFLDFFFASAVVGTSQTANSRFRFLQWMLGDILVAIADRRAAPDPFQEAISLMSVDLHGLPETYEVVVRAAQTSLASHLLARSGRIPWGIEDRLSAEALAELAVGVHILMWVKCFEARGELGDARIITLLLPSVVSILQMSADGHETTLEAFTSGLWLRHAQMDAGLLF